MDMTITEAIGWIRLLKTQYILNKDYNDALDIAIDTMEEFISLPNEVFEKPLTVKAP